MKDYCLNFAYKYMMPLLTLGFAASFFILFLYWWSRDITEWKPGLGEAFSMTCNVLYGYIASYIFFFINIYAPEKKELRTRGKQVANRIREFKRKIPIQRKTIKSSFKPNSNIGTPQEVFEGHMEILQKDYELLTNWINDIEVNDRIIQNLYLILFSHQFKQYTLSSWDDFTLILQQNIDKLINELSELETPLANLVTHNLKKKV